MPWPDVVGYGDMPEDLPRSIPRTDHDDEPERPKAIALRTATRADAELLYRWANDPETRRQSFSSEPIPWPTHLAWLERRLADPLTLILIGEVDGVPIGVVRFQEHVISVTVAPDRRGKGYGRALIRAGCATQTGSILAEIKPDNAASIRAFTAAGFVPAGGDERALRFVRP